MKFSPIICNADKALFVKRLIFKIIALNVADSISMGRQETIFR
jgi:hypothetical protein